MNRAATWTLLASTLGWGVDALAGDAGQQGCPCSTAPFLRRCGPRLYLNNQEFRTIGFNTYQLFRPYAGLDAGPEARSQSRELIRSLSSRGSFLLRVAGPMNAAEYRTVFFDPDPRRQEARRLGFYDAISAMLEDAAAGGHRIVFSLAWDFRAFSELGGHSLRTLVTTSASPGRTMLYEYVSNVTRRFAEDPRIAFWETDNEADLFAGRGQGHYSFQELARFNSELIAKIRAADPNHLVSTGASEEAVWHVGAKGSTETPGDHEAHLVEEQAAADLISVHYYYNSSLPIGWYAGVAERAGKPLYIGEAGVAFDRQGNAITNADYVSKRALDDVKQKLRAALRNNASIALWWNLQQAPGEHFDLNPQRTPRAFREIEKANRKTRKGLRRLSCPQ